MRMHAAQVAAAVGGTLHGPDTAVDGVAIDSRDLTGRPLFVALEAERDGHDFIPAAVAGGAAVVLATHEVVGGGDTWIEVADTRAALLDVGRLARTHLPEQVVGITGSVGKTSTKDLLVAVLQPHRTTAASVRSFNNELGVPLTLANAPDGVEAVVVEMGARGVGHIALLCDVARPTIGVVTAVADAHLELFGSVEQVARAKGELVEALPASGTAVLNLDDPRVAAMADRTAASVVGYGLGAGCVRAERVSLDEQLRPSFDLVTDWGSAPTSLAVHGRHQVSNALAAAAAALACGLPVDEVAAGLGTGALSAMRMELVRVPGGPLVVNDAYNANPTSMRAALRALAELPAERRVAVLGPMAELGAATAGLHAEIAAEARSAGIRVVAVGAADYGIEGPDAVDSVAEAFDRLAGLGPGDAVLVKASRVAELEQLVRLLAPVSD